MLYSLILEFRGGTHISQGHGSTTMEGLFRCIYHLNKVDGLDCDELLEELDGEEDIEIEGLESIWCFTATIDGDLVLMNLVATIG